MIRLAFYFLACSLLGAALPASADIYGYIDEQGRGHFSNVPQDSRFRIFKKEVGGAATYSQFNNGMTRQPSPRLANASPASRNRYAGMIATVAKEQRIDPALLHAVITVESGYNAGAKSPAGAVGLMQLMPDTARRYDVGNIWDPLENLRAGARYLRYLLGLFNDNLSLTLAAYNAGEGAVIKAGHRIPNFAETRLYVPKVLTYYDRYRANGT
jgi:soluble lytic murein transglycosylase-like protein